MVVDLDEGEASAVAASAEPATSTYVDDCIKAVASCTAGMVPHNPFHKDSVAYAVADAVVVAGGAWLLDWLSTHQGEDDECPWVSSGIGLESRKTGERADLGQLI